MAKDQNGKFPNGPNEMTGKSLTDQDIKTDKTIDRRSMLRGLGTGALGVGALGVGTGRAQAQ
ncbi:MAG: hypothetical protein ACI81Q_000315, partial [Paracoccaceae bacterium]